MDKLIVVIPTHNRNALLRRTLASLAECRRPASLTRTIVVENGGQFAADVVVREAAASLACEYLYSAPGNKSAALNALLACVSDELLVFLDDDVRLDAGVLEAYAAAAITSERCFFGGPCGVDYEEEPPQWLQSYLPPSAAGLKFSSETRDIDQPRFMGFNWAARAADLRDMGGFDPNFGPGSKSFSTGQEATMQRALLAAGFRGLVVPGALVWHYVPRERCTPEWTLRRSRQGGISQGLRSSAGDMAWRGWRPALACEAALWSTRLIKELAIRDKQGTFHARWRLARIRGEAEGRRKARLLDRENSERVVRAPESFSETLHEPTGRQAI